MSVASIILKNFFSKLPQTKQSSLVLSTWNKTASSLRGQQQQQRLFSTSQRRTQSDDERNFPVPHIPALMDFNQIRYPHMRHYFRNFFFTHFLIRPYFDTSFSKSDFLEGAKSAVEFVSNCLATGDLQSLQESRAVTPECLKEIQRNLSMFTMSERQTLALKKEDILFNFIYQIGIMLEDHPEQILNPESTKQIRHVEITYVAHAVQNYQYILQNSSSATDLKDQMLKQGGPIIINYRFIREYTKEVEDAWTLNVVNYFYQIQD